MASHYKRLPALHIALVVVALVTLTPARGQSDGSLQDMGFTATFPEESNTTFPEADDNGNSSTPTNSEDSSDNEKAQQNSNTKQFIFKGDTAYPGEFKYQAALLVNVSGTLYFICGGVLLSANHALTAAHCVDRTDREYHIAVGIHNLSLGLGNPGSQITKVSSVKIHPRWGRYKSAYPNDIAVLCLEDEITTNSFVQFTKIANRSQLHDFDRTYCVISGWGKTENGFPNILNFGYQYITDVQDCRDFWAVAVRTGISKRHVCGHYYPVGPCFGDSGSPLICGKIVIGVLSWGLGSCSGCFPEVYTRLAYFDKWIKKTMNQCLN